MNIYDANIDRGPDRNDKVCRFMLVSDDDRRELGALHHFAVQLEHQPQHADQLDQAFG